MAYCSKCGKLVEEGSAFCSGCGAAASDSSVNQNQNWSNNYGPQSGPQQSADGLGGTLTIILVLGILWAISSIISGIACMVGGSFLSFLPVTGAVYIGVGILYFIGGLFALLSCMFIFKLENFNKAYTYCLIGSIIALLTGGVIIGVIGIVFALLMKKEQFRFKS